MIQVADWIAGALMLLSYLPYIRGIMKNTVKPSVSTWLIWAILDVLLCGAMLQKGTINWMLVGATVGAIVIAILAIMKGTTNWNKFDTLCAAGAVAGAGAWICTNEALWGIIMFLIAISFGAIPTFIRGWKTPERENMLSWAMKFIACTITLALVQKWTVANVAQPIVFLTIQAVMVLLLLRRKA